MDSQTRSAARIVWDYLRLGHTPRAADAIFVLGSHDLRVAERAAELFRQQFAPLLICSGGSGNLTRGLWPQSEAEMFAEVALRQGVPSSAIILETRASNTGENVRFTRELLRTRGVAVRSLLAVQKPYMERRTFATIRQWWPEVEVVVTSPQLDFDEYCSGAFSMEQVLHIMVGDMQRVIEYPARGFMQPQEVPDSVRDACAALVAAGFTGNLLKPP